MPANSDNYVALTGNLAEDPELRFTSSGVAVVQLRLAVNNRRYDKNTQGFVDDLDGFFSINAWRDLAEHVAESLSKGDRVTVTGRLRSRSYEDREGQTRWVTEVEADEVAPSLKWATAKPQRAPRNGNDGGGRQAPPQAASVPTDEVPF